MYLFKFSISDLPPLVFWLGAVFASEGPDPGRKLRFRNTGDSRHVVERLRPQESKVSSQIQGLSRAKGVGVGKLCKFIYAVTYCEPC
jgi:hypothetical protein